MVSAKVHLNLGRFLALIIKVLYTKKACNYIEEGERKMELILSSIVTMIVNLIIFSIIPFIWWLIRHRKKENFFTWLGFIKPKLKSKWWVLQRLFLH